MSLVTGPSRAMSPAIPPPISHGRDDAPSFAHLPADILRLLFSRLPSCSLVNCQRVCKNWKLIIDRDILTIPVLQELFFQPRVQKNAEPQQLPPTKEDFGTPSSKALLHATTIPEDRSQAFVEIRRTSSDDAVKLPHKSAFDLLTFESDAQRDAVVRRPLLDIKAAYITPSNQFVTVLASSVVSIWDPNSLKCLHSMTVFSIPSTDKDLNTAYPEVRSTFLMGSLLIIRGFEGKKKEFRGWYRYGCLYAVNLNDFSKTKLLDAHAREISCMSSGTHLFAVDSKKDNLNPHGYRLSENGRTLAKIWNAIENNFIKSFTTLLGVNRDCLIYRHSSFMERSCVDKIVCADTGKILHESGESDDRDKHWFMTKHLAVVAYKLKPSVDLFLDVYVTPVGKKIASLNFTKLSNDKIDNIHSIVLEKDRFTVFYQVPGIPNYRSFVLSKHQGEETSTANAYAPTVPTTSDPPSSFFSPADPTTTTANSAGEVPEAPQDIEQQQIPQDSGWWENCCDFFATIGNRLLWPFKWFVNLFTN